MIDRVFNHVALVVEDLPAAMSELTRAIGLRWQKPHHSRYGKWSIEGVYSIERPFVELVVGEPGGPWDTAGGPRPDHIGYYSDDLAADSARLAADGVGIHFDPATVGPGGVFVYHHAPRSGARLGIVRSHATRTEADDVRHDADVMASDGEPVTTEPYFHVCFAVPDLEAAMEELTQSIGVSWQEPRERTQGELHWRLVRTVDGPPCIELIEGRPGTPWHAPAEPRMDHFGQFTDDLTTAIRKVEAAGGRIEVDGREISGPWAHLRLPQSGALIELIEADDTARSRRYGVAASAQ